MLMQEPTPERIKHWQKVYAYFRPLLRPNRKSGPQIVDYLNHRYSLKKIYSDEWKEVVSFNVLNNQHNKAKLPEGKSPHPMILSLIHI